MENFTRRQSERTELHAPISPMLRWRGSSGEHDGCISNVSLDGCFINTRGPARVGEIIGFDMPMPGGGYAELKGRVVHVKGRPVGFGVRFEGLTARERAYLNRLIAEAKTGFRQ